MLQSFVFHVISGPLLRNSNVGNASFSLNGPPGFCHSVLLCFASQRDGADSKEGNAPELCEGQATSCATEEALSQSLYIHLILSVLVQPDRNTGFNTQNENDFRTRAHTHTHTHTHSDSVKKISKNV